MVVREANSFPSLRSRVRTSSAAFASRGQIWLYGRGFAGVAGGAACGQTRAFAGKRDTNLLPPCCHGIGRRRLPTTSRWRCWRPYARRWPPAMARPWRRHRRWPHVAKSGARSYGLGFYDHEDVERSRSFPTAKAAREWIGDYVAAERRGSDSLRRFLLDLDAQEANAVIETRTIGEIVQLYFAFNAPTRRTAWRPRRSALTRGQRNGICSGMRVRAGAGECRRRNMP